MDVAEMDDDPETEQLLDIYASQFVGLEDADEVNEEINEEFDLDPGDIDEVVLFVDDLEGSQQFGENAFGMIAHGAFDTDSVVEAIEEEEGELETVEYGEQTVFTFEDGSLRGDTGAVAALDDGQIVVGDRASVESAIDTAAGERDALDGELRDAYDDATDDGVIALVVEDPVDEFGDGQIGMGVDTSSLEPVNVLSYRYYTGDGTVGSEVRLYTDRSADAEDIRDVIAGALVALGDTGSQEIDDEVDKITAEHDGSDVIVTYKSELSDVEALLEVLLF